ncbi:malto-oligosyltrehalose synthase [Streptomyces spiramenti]|uniref:Malto-oligosyltrehalose synthase n=1 Tax=Streptomyces spiramenti TaxID=2720606 RepID=A0ABX1AKQ0_9ACTN|nr:malto-oligosyltrehalose synthase [Streptomyces spiramenti]NJP65072.1 malto-oligosyltrehalose synthase [Streptomyces spiramenti]
MTPTSAAPAPGARTAPPPAVPTATYRLQLRPEFPFSAAEQLVPHLARLGVSHLHLSPLLESAAGSAHGYDVTRHDLVRPELGGEDGLRSLARTAAAHGMALVADLVPNHMAVPSPAAPGDPLWDVLLHGRGSRHARWFDIDWEAGGGRLLLPVLGGPVGAETESFRVADGELRLGDHLRLPLCEGTADLPLPRLLEAQHYRLAWWRLARTELNYRRFFTVNELIALRVEDPEVFEATHRTVLRLVAEGVIGGLRVDHPDGLADPAGYFRRLSERTGGVWTVAEKILGRGERLPLDWRVAGTTGYDALHHIDGVLTDGRGLAGLTEQYRAWTGAEPDLGGEWEATVRRATARVVRHDLAAEVTRLTRAAGRVCAADPSQRFRDHAPWALRTAIEETLAALPVYRPYVPADGPATPADEAMLRSAAERARTAFGVPAESDAVVAVRELALGRLGSGADREDFRARFAQTSAALRAKAVEDLAFYRWTPLLSACEVGGEPGGPAVAPDVFHDFCERRQRDWPGTGTVVSTHDTKRSADVRAVLLALAEHPDLWARALPALAEEAERAGTRPPDAHLAWGVWQNALGLGVPDPERLGGAALKSAREAALHTGWTEPDAAYERALAQFVKAGPCGAAAPLLSALREELAESTRAVTLAQTLLQLTMPGVPDLYQGTETLAPALVDPDNRRPVAFPEAALRAVAPVPGDDGAAPPREEPGDPVDLATEKLRLTAVALRLRRDHPAWFGPDGEYRAVTADGPLGSHCLAFTRAGRVLTVVTRLARGVDGRDGWQDTALAVPPGVWTDRSTGRVLTVTEAGEGVPVAELLAGAPVALLVRTG